MTTQLRDAAGKAVRVQQGESCDVVVTFKDMTGAAIAKASLLSLVATLYDESTSAIINSRNAVSVLDANGGTVASDGTLTLRLQPADSPIVTASSVAVGEAETHVLRIDWTWSDGVLTRTGREEWSILVERIASPS